MGNLDWPIYVCGKEKFPSEPQRTPCALNCGQWQIGRYDSNEYCRDVHCGICIQMMQQQGRIATAPWTDPNVSQRYGGGGGQVNPYGGYGGGGGGQVVDPGYGGQNPIPPPVPAGFGGGGGGGENPDPKNPFAGGAPLPAFLREDEEKKGSKKSKGKKSSHRKHR
ncbi:hypothetical protein QBC32DRAFT_397286 [Pseudoneurospora amorphoporcata]|uniref:Uncharacterized protein n=1 Tax=Pseudoneurospora amorphoporcata TaxID=241081 RepID=A0AAN6NW77_9PEZI|nr:hypothetical protein QBC32DRAFT_397286 [Pseudoneurospora amorphoporcata]